LASFIRDTYDAIPLSLPDTRLVPLVVLTGTGPQIRLLGTLEDMPRQGEFNPPVIQEADLPDIASRVSSAMSWKAAFGLVGPFISNVLGLGPEDVKSNVSADREKNASVQISMSGAKRHHVSPLAIAKVVAAGRFSLPAVLVGDFETSGHAVYLVDSVLTARDLKISLLDNAAAEMAAEAEVAIAGKAHANAVVRSRSSLKINGLRRAPFAFTCVRLNIDENGCVAAMAVSARQARLGMTGAAAPSALPHELLGGANELLSFD
jgi:hypothetical protein